jgi:two-component system NarL family response regulator
MSQQRIRVLVADDHPIVRDGVTKILNRQPDIRVVASAADGGEAVTLFRRDRPDVTFVDLRMPVLHGVEVVEQVRKEFPEAVMVVLTTYDTDDDIDRALRAGAKGYLLKDVTPVDLVACVPAVHGGGSWVSQAITSKLVARVGRVQITPREMGVLRQLASGKANKEIAVALTISEATVKIHVAHLLEKLGATSRTEAVAKAADRGLVRLG